MNYDVNVYTDDIEKCFTILQQVLVNIKAIKALLQNTSNLTTDYSTLKESFELLKDRVNGFSTSINTDNLNVQDITLTGNIDATNGSGTFNTLYQNRDNIVGAYQSLLYDNKDRTTIEIHDDATFSLYFEPTTLGDLRGYGIKSQYINTRKYFIISNEIQIDDIDNPYILLTGNTYDNNIYEINITDYPSPKYIWAFNIDLTTKIPIRLRLNDTAPGRCDGLSLGQDLAYVTYAPFPKENQPSLSAASIGNFVYIMEDTEL